MKTFLMAVLALGVFGFDVGICEGQVKAVEAGSAEAQESLQEHRRLLSMKRAERGELLLYGMKVGAWGNSSNSMNENITLALSVNEFAHLWKTFSPSDK